MVLELGRSNSPWVKKNGGLAVWKPGAKLWHLEARAITSGLGIPAGRSWWYRLESGSTLDFPWSGNMSCISTGCCYKTSIGQTCTKFLASLRSLKSWFSRLGTPVIHTVFRYFKKKKKRACDSSVLAGLRQLCSGKCDSLYRLMLSPAPARSESNFVLCGWAGLWLFFFFISFSGWQGNSEPASQILPQIKDLRWLNYYDSSLLDKLRMQSGKQMALVRTRPPKTEPVPASPIKGKLGRAAERLGNNYPVGSFWQHSTICQGEGPNLRGGIKARPYSPGTEEEVPCDRVNICITLCKRWLRSNRSHAFGRARSHFCWVAWCWLSSCSNSLLHERTE